MPTKSYSQVLLFFRSLFKSKIFIGVAVIFLIFLGNFFLFRHSPTYQFVNVHRGSITESVSLTGNTTPTQSVSLAFGLGGIISHTYSDIGKKVEKGQVLAELNTNDLVAQLSQAQSSVDAQKAKLDSLKSGSRPEDIAVSQATLDKAKQDLLNMYTGILDTSTDSYAKANDAVRTELNQLFTNGQGLTYSTSDLTSKTNTEMLQTSSIAILNKWQNDFTNVDTSENGLENFLQNEISYLATIWQFLNSVSKTLDSSPSLSVTTLATYKADVSIALNEVNVATKNLNIISQNIASQKLTISQAQAGLNLKTVGALPSDISAQEAQVSQAQANVESVKAKLQNAQIVSPIGGVVTQFDAKIGQIASTNIPLVSIMSSGGYEIDAGVSEIDIGKISVGNKVLITLDAFPSENFTGLVFYIAPAETNVGGVVSYQTKISFNKIDPRFKSGLTANVDIQTKQKDNVLILPQYAILQNDQGTFVEVLVNNNIQQNGVTLGIGDQKGSVEVVSGVTENEAVLNIGLKAK